MPPAQNGRQHIDAMFIACGEGVQNNRAADIFAGRGIALGQETEGLPSEIAKGAKA